MIERMLTLNAVSHPIATIPFVVLSAVRWVAVIKRVRAWWRPD